MNVTFYRFAKNDNSTKRPSGGGTSRNITLKGGCSIINPVLIMKREDYNHRWNYAYIPDFERYYFINDTVFVNAVVEVHCNVDYMASWKSGIGASTQYVIRSASAFDGDVVDNLYPIKGGISSVVDTDGAYITPGEGSSVFAEGAFILGVVSTQASVGCIQYYAVNAAYISELCTKIMNYITDTGGGITDSWISRALVNLLVDPINKIITTNWFPCKWTEIPGTAQSGIVVGDWGMSLSDNSVKPLSQGTLSAGGLVTKSFDISQHPLASTRGNYLNMEPYTHAELVWQPFGVLPIDTTLIYGATSIDAYLRWDWATGEGWLECNANKTGGNILQILNVQGHVGVPFQIAQQNVDVIQAMTSTVGLAASAGARDPVGIASGVGDVLHSMRPEMSSSGAVGNVVSYQSVAIPRFIQRFYVPADDDNTRRGRPLMQSRTISTLSGYVQCDHVELDLPCTETEMAQIKSTMEGGFFYE